MASETNFGAGGNFLERAKARANETARKDAEKAVLEPKLSITGGNAKTVEGATQTGVPAQKPEPDKQASAQGVAVPSKEAAPNAVEKQASEVVTARTAVRVESDDALIELPGRKPMTAKQLAWELDRSRDTDRRTSELRLREERLVEREKQKEEPKRSVESAPKREPIRERPKFSAPRGLTDGDPEYDDARSAYQAELAAWEIEKSGLRPLIEPLIDKVALLERRLSEKDDESARREATLIQNRKNYMSAMVELPFETDGLDQATQNAVFDHIRSTANTLYNFDIGDPAQMREREYSASDMARAVLRAFPPGTMPPGYEREKPSDALLHLDLDKPLAEKPQPDPLPEVGPAGVAYRGNAKEEERKGQDFSSKVKRWMAPAQSA